MEAKFVASISKGSRYNQIYIPIDAKPYFKPGDKVEIRLIEKKLYTHGKNVKLSNFKKYIIKEIFSRLDVFKEIDNIIVFGSFITEKAYRDIDITIIVNKSVSSEFENKLHTLLTEELNQNFHILIYKTSELETMAEYCPLIRSMLSNYVSSKKLDIGKTKQVNKKHIKFLLMMPQDLLRIKLPPRIYYDNLRRLCTIKNFLKNRSLDTQDINKEVYKNVGELTEKLKKNENISLKELHFIKDLMKKEIKMIKDIIEKRQNGQKT